MEIIYRALPFEEHYKAQPLFEAMFPTLPYPKPEVARIHVAEADGKVVGLWVFQLCAHAEPAAVDPAYGHLVSLPKLLKSLHDYLQETDCGGMEYYIYTATSDWDEPLQRAGFTPIGFAYRNRVPEVKENDGSSSSVGNTSSS